MPQNDHSPQDTRQDLDIVVKHTISRFNVYKSMERKKMKTN